MTNVIVKAVVGKKSFKLWFNCKGGINDVNIFDNKIVEFSAWGVVINSKKSSKVYRRYFYMDLTNTFHTKVEFRRQLHHITISRRGSGCSESWIIQGE